MEPFVFMLSGGHPNSLGRTIEVVETVLSDTQRMSELYECYSSSDPVVRLRTSNAMKRVLKERPEWFPDWCDRFLEEVSLIDQPSAKWTLSQLWLEHEKRLTPDQKLRAKNLMIRTLYDEDDWIVLNMTMKTLEHWAKKDTSIGPQVELRARSLADDKRKSVAKGAQKLLKACGLPLL